MPSQPTPIGLIGARRGMELAGVHSMAVIGAGKANAAFRPITRVGFDKAQVAGPSRHAASNACTKLRYACVGTQCLTVTPSSLVPRAARTGS